MVRSHFKHNQVEAAEVIIPNFYIEDDIALSGLVLKPEDVLVNTHLLFANNVSSILNVSASTNFSSINTLAGIAPYFVKQNKLTNITPFGFESDILVPLGYTFGSFSTSTAFLTYLSGTLLPSIRLNSPTALTHETLIESLSWFYFLNTSAANYSPSAYVANKLVDLYFGKDLHLNDGIKGLETFLWNNYATCSVLQNLGLVPANYLSGTDTYTSGTQQLAKLNTLVDVVYSPLVIDEEDTYVQDAFEDYISAATLLQSMESGGPYHRLLKALSYSKHDIDDEIEQLHALYNLEKCPDTYLPYVAELIGWNLYGHDPQRWRLQLRNATSIYKAKGTKRALQVALDSIFSESFLNISGAINELHESYIPYLTYYALATESNVLSGFNSWTQNIAQSFGVSDYSTQSMDVNLRLVVDYILLAVVKQYPDYFKFNGKNWDLTDPKFKFNYRGGTKSIPPFEEFKYYKDLHLSESLIDFLTDKIACFGVPASFITSLRAYIKDHTINSESLLELDNRWLFFLSGLQTPPNYNKLLTTTSKNLLDYVGLWCGKSSHFNVNLEASSFTYDRRSLVTSSTLVLQEALRAITDFTPAHAIPDINLLLTDNEYVDYNEFPITFVESDIIEYPNGSGCVPGFYSSGTNMSSLGKIFGRGAADNILDLAFSSVSGLSNLPRNTVRRRSLHNLLPTNKLYNKTGFNMPMPNLVSTIEYSLSGLGFLPLGYIPSAFDYVHIPYYSAIPAIYGKCETLNSSSVYSGVPVSATYPVRGLSSLQVSTVTRYATYGDTHPIYYLINKILYNREKLYWYNYISTSAGWTQFGASAAIYDLSTSLANSSFNPSTYAYYENFAFNYGVHKVYNDWVKFFGRANINIGSLNLSGGKDIFSHTYGPLLYNAKFDIFGSAVNTSAQLIASALDELYDLNNNSGSGVLSYAGSSIGTYVVSTPQSNPCIRNEFRNKSIIKNVEFVGTSGASLNNKFDVINVAVQNKTAGSTNYFVHNPAIKSKSVNGFPRMIYHFSDAGNILMPEHEFKLNLRYFAGFETGDKFGGAEVGVWIHTEPEGGMMWNWTPNQQWELYTIPSSLKLNDLKPFFHLQADPVTNVIPSSVSSLTGGCYNPDTNTISLLTLEHISSSLFNTLEVKFNTLNQLILLPQVYYGTYKQVHKNAQSYVVEMFKVPKNDTNSYVIFDELTIIDTTENDRVLEYIPKDLLLALNFFKDSANDRASRVASVTSGNYFTSGGSRINLRAHPQWTSYAQNANSQLSSMDFIN